MSQIETLKLLISRLERLSADSYWAHQASGIRGSLLRWLDQLEKEHHHSREVQDEQNKLQREKLLKRGFYLLERAASERLKRGSG